MMRIITGTAKGVHLESLEGDDSTRPTAERAKEAVFSAIQFDVEGRRVLDLFAGSGQMGLEALSRGAVQAMFIDASDKAIATVKRNAVKAKLADRAKYLISDYRNYLRKARGGEPFSLVFIDPPYAMRAVPEALARLLDYDLVTPDCIFVCESEEPDVFEGKEELGEHFVTRKTGKYGRAYITILTLKEDAE
jgi:16S rRNA (guanine(966)-N(2))-methyltransferase RsmD